MLLANVILMNYVILSSPCSKKLIIYNKLGDSCKCALMKSDVATGRVETNYKFY